jgi:hypothetical protein
MSVATIARRALGLCIVVAGLLTAGPAGAAAATSSPTCNAPALTQAYSWALDSNWYAALPGVAWDTFSSGGWTLSGGAKVVTTTLADGVKAPLLVLPSGATAVSTQMCVSNSYPTFRGEIRDVKGTSGVKVSIAYSGTKGWGSAASFGTLAGSGTAWTIPSVLSIKPSIVEGWQYGRFTFAAQGTNSEYQLSNLYADPRMR